MFNDGSANSTESTEFTIYKYLINNNKHAKITN